MFIISLLLRVLFTFVLMASFACFTPLSKVQTASARSEVEELLNFVKKDGEDWPEEWVFEEAALALGRIRSQRAAKYLNEVFNDPKSGSIRRIAAAKALERIENRSSIIYLTGALQNSQTVEELYWLLKALSVYQDPKIKGLLEHYSGHQNILVSKISKKGLLNYTNASK